MAAMTTAEINLLGPVTVTADGADLDVGHARQLTVLAALAIEPGRALAAEVLIGRVWGDRPPQRARETLHSYLSRLRKVLGPAGVTIDHRPAGYVMVSETGAVDLYRFRALVRQAESDAGSGDRDDGGADEAAFETLTRALDLWRGPALQGIETSWAERVRQSLGAEHHAAERHRTDIGLRLGRHAELVADLLAAGADNPWDERVAAQTMLALYRCGRQSEAMETYQAIRHRLADDLGADPGAALRDLLQRILEADPTLLAPTRRPGARGTSGVSSSGVPRQLPGAPASFSGRTVELAELSRMLAVETGEHATIVAISAGGGMGKTWLARRWADEHADGYPDGQLFADLHGFDPAGEPVSTGTVLQSFLLAAGVAQADIPVSLDDRAALYRSTLARRRMLIVLDNAPDSSTIAPLLPGTAACAVLVTTRRRLGGLAVTHGVRTLQLDVMSEQESRAVLAGQLGRSIEPAEMKALDTILALCAGLPLALGIAAARISALPRGTAVVDYAHDLQSAEHRLDALDAGELSASLRAVLGTSTGALTRDAATLFALLGRAPGPDHGLSAVASLVGVDPATTRSRLDELVAAHLVHHGIDGRFRMHDLVRLHAAEIGSAAFDSSEVAIDGNAGSRGGSTVGDLAQLRLLDHLLHSAHAAAALLSAHQSGQDLPGQLPGVLVDVPSDVDAAMAWFLCEERTLVAAIDHADARRLDDYGYLLPRALATYYDRRGHWQEWAHAQEVAVGAAERRGDRLDLARARRLLANAYSNLRRYDDARAQLAFALDDFETLGDADGLAHVHFDIALLHDRAGEPADALLHAEQALRAYRAVPYPLGEAVALNAVGWYHAQIGELAEALACCEQSLELGVEIDSDYARSNALDSLGYVHHQLGQYPAAADRYRQAIELFRSMGDRHGEAIATDHLGDSVAAGGDASGALEAWQAAAQALTTLGHPEAAAVQAKADGR